MRPLKHALVVAGSYAVLSAAWIAVSGRVAARSSGSVEELRAVEQIKGVAFVLTSSLAIFGLCYASNRKLARDAQALVRQREALVEADRRAVLGTFTAGAAHDFRNLLTVVSGYGELMAASRDCPESHRRYLAQLEAAAARGTAIADQLARAGRVFDPKERRAVDLGRLAAEVLDLVRLHPDAKKVTLTLRDDGPAVVTGAETLLHQAAMNLVLNAVQAAPTGRVEIRVLRDGQDAVLEVHDDGPGVPDAMRERVVAGLTTTKERGSGLGLLSVRACVDLHRGRVELATSDLGGAMFRLRAPAAD